MILDGLLIPVPVVEQELGSLGDVLIGDEYEPWAAVHRRDFSDEVWSFAGMVDEATQPPSLFCGVHAELFAVVLEEVHEAPVVDVHAVLVLSLPGRLRIDDLPCILHHEFSPPHVPGGDDSSSLAKDSSF